MLTALAAPATLAASHAATYAALHSGAHWVGWPFFLLIPLFWIAVFVAFFVFVGRRRMRWQSPGHLAERTLAERFAKGDIDEVEYRARLEVIRANRR